MAKKMMKSDAMVCAPGACGPKCIVMGLVSAAFAAGGLWMIVSAVLKQMSGMMPTSNVFLWYFGGLVLWCIAKMCKMKACSYCARC